LLLILADWLCMLAVAATKTVMAWLAMLLLLLLLLLLLPGLPMWLLPAPLSLGTLPPLVESAA
jgi:hypothetical protein